MTYEFKPFPWNGRLHGSKDEALIIETISGPSPVPWAFEPVLRCRCCPRRQNERWADWAAWCPDGWHAVVWEQSSRLLDDADYLRHFLAVRLPWYRDHSDRYFLILSDSEKTAKHADATARRLLADDASLLHEMCEDGRSRGTAEIFRSILEGRLTALTSKKIAA